MVDIRKLALCAALGLALSACSKEGDEDSAERVPPTEATPAAVAEPAIPVKPGPEDIVPVTVAADAVTVGNSLEGDKVVKAASPQFTTSDTVYAGASVRGKPAGAEVAVYWTYEDGLTHKEERRPLAAGEQYVKFSFAKADGMKPGKYNAQIDINMVPIGITDFVVK